jgi:glycosyltransferase involved in cell wall biosynthesis
MLQDIWSKQRPDLVHIATEGPLGWSALKVAKKLHIPVCTDFRTNFHAYSSHYRVGWLQRPIMAYLKKFHNLADCTTVPTESLKAELEQDGFKRLVVVPRGIDMSRFHPANRTAELRHQWGAQDNDIVLLYVGRVAPEKNLELLASTFEKVKALAPRVQCVVVGDGPSLAALRTQLPWVHFAGAQKGEALAQHYASADVFVFPSLTETFGNVVPEAMASGLATVCFDYAAGQQLIQHGHNGLLCDTQDPQAFTRTTLEAVLNHHLRDQIRAETRSSPALQDWNDILLKVEQLWLHLVSFRPIP